MTFNDGIIQLAYEAGYDTDDEIVLALVSQYYSISGTVGSEVIDSWDATFFGMAEPTNEQVYAASARYDARIEAREAAIAALQALVDPFVGDDFLSMTDADKWNVVAAQLYLCGLLDQDLKVIDPSNW